MDKLTVHFDDQPIYDIVFSESFDDLSQVLADFHLSSRRVCIVSESRVAGFYMEALKDVLRPLAREVVDFVFPEGEASKNLNTVQKLYERLILAHFDRKDLLVALGGGVVGDLTGFAAATYLRGIDFIQVPTSLLAQVDSSIGGKTGVDFLKYKNMVGAFHQPRMVYMNVSTLCTLPLEQFSCGMGEVVKHGFIRDASYSRWLYENRAKILALDTDTLSEMICRSCVIKKTVVENDPTEQGERAVLNMGHTVGHAVEKLKDFRLLHGQCVAVGTVASAYLSMRRGMITVEEYENVKQLLEAFGLPVSTDGLRAEEVLSVTKSDKKMEQGRIKFILMKEPGYAVVDKTVTDEELLTAIREILE